MNFTNTKRAAAMAVVIVIMASVMSILAASTDARAAREAQERPEAVQTASIQAPPPEPVAAVLETEEAVEEEPDEARYNLTAEERDTVERVVMAEAGGEPFEGQVLVAQCILNAAEETGTPPSEAVVAYKYASARPEPSQSVKDAVAAVFDRGETVVDDTILWFYNPAKVSSPWHEMGEKDEQYPGGGS